MRQVFENALLWLCSVVACSNVTVSLLFAAQMQVLVVGIWKMNHVTLVQKQNQLLVHGEVSGFLKLAWNSSACRPFLFDHAA
jgi:hypothetical protein